MRNFGSISVKEKILIVSQIIAGEKIQAVARKHGVSRPSIYAWTGESFRYFGASTKTREEEKNNSFLMPTVL